MYDQTLRVMRDALIKARLGNSDRMTAIARLDQQSRALEAIASGSSFESLLQSERGHSRDYGGRSVFGLE